jgi:uridine monophosphate synthetase
LPIAAIISTEISKPMIYKRKEDKAYGLKKAIVGKYNKGDVCIVLEDLITTGESTLETTEAFQNEELSIKDVVIVIDRSADNGKAIRDKGFNLHSLYTMKEITTILRKHNKISESKEKEILDFIEKMKTTSETKKSVGIHKKREFKNPLTNKLYNTMMKKKSNLVLSLDVEDKNTFFSILEKTAPYIVMLKTHIDIIKDFNPDFIKELKDYSKKYEFHLFEDRKFADIGNTVRKQYQSGIYNISEWSDFVTVHMIAGETILDGLFGNIENRSSFLLARMSSKDNLITENYTRRVIEIGKNNENTVSGFIGHGKDEEDLRKFRNKIPENFLLLTPGVKLESNSDNLGQTYMTPEKAIRGGADCIIVGRGIIKSDNPSKTAELYRDKAWKEYNTNL